MNMAYDRHEYIEIFTPNNNKHSTYSSCIRMCTT